jgi:hypothetical protein
MDHGSFKGMTNSWFIEETEGEIGVESFPILSFGPYPGL